MINSIFDLLNSRNRFVTDPSKAPISKDNISVIKQKVERYTEYICRLQVTDLKTKNRVRIISSGRRTGFIGMLVSMRSALGLSDHLEEFGMDYLLTYKMSQDHIETLFRAIRKDGGFNNNPSFF